MTDEIKRYAVLINLALFCIASWYIVAELILSVIWQNVWH